jgi:hypothetical protein
VHDDEHRRCARVRGRGRNLAERLQPSGKRTDDDDFVQSEDLTLFADASFNVIFGAEISEAFLVLQSERTAHTLPTRASPFPTPSGSIF